MVRGLERLERRVLLMKGEGILVEGRGRWGEIRGGRVLGLDKNLMVCRGIVKDGLSRLEVGPHLGWKKKSRRPTSVLAYIQIRELKPRRQPQPLRKPAIRHPVSRAGAGLADDDGVLLGGPATLDLCSALSLPIPLIEI